MASPTAQARHILSPRFSVDASPPPANLQPAQLPFIEEVKTRSESKILSINKAGRSIQTSMKS